MHAGSSARDPLIPHSTYGTYWNDEPNISFCLAQCSHQKSPYIVTCFAVRHLAKASWEAARLLDRTYTIPLTTATIARSTMMGQYPAFFGSCGMGILIPRR